MKPQTRTVLRLLQERGSLTSMEALRYAGSDRLAARIYEIRQALGRHVIEKTTAKAGRKRFARYVWHGGNGA